MCSTKQLSIDEILALFNMTPEEGAQAIDLVHEMEAETVMVNGVATLVPVPMSEAEMMADFEERFHDVFPEFGSLFNLTDEALYITDKLQSALMPNGNPHCAKCGRDAIDLRADGCEHCGGQ